MTTRAVRDKDLFSEVRALLGKKHTIPNKTGYGGSGGAGRLLEELLHVKANNQDIPDAGRWELKFTNSKSYLTLFHKDPQPRIPSVIKQLVMHCGWPSGDAISFRHTVWGYSKRGFSVELGSGRVSVVNKEYPNITPYWEDDVLSNSVIPKLRNLILVRGTVIKNYKNNQVLFHSAQANYGFKLSKFRNGLREGWIAIDFDARTNPPKNDGSFSIRNHGTKFRVKLEDLGRMYSQSNYIK